MVLGFHIAMSLTVSRSFLPMRSLMVKHAIEGAASFQISGRSCHVRKDWYIIQLEHESTASIMDIVCE